MKHITEEHIEKFVRYPELLSKDEKNAIKEVIGQSRELRQLAQWFEDFYADLDELDRKHGDHVVSLQPIDYKSAQGSPHNQLIFAAKSDVKQEEGLLETLATFASEEQQIIVRILRDNGKEQYQIHLLYEEEPNENEMNILTLIDRDIDFIIDSSRHVSFPLDEQWEDIDWQKVSLSLRKPLTYRKISKEYLSDDCLDLLLIEGISVRLHQTDSVLKIKKDPLISKECSRVVIKGKNMGCRLFRFREDHKLKVSLSQLEPVSVWFFN